MNEFISKLDHFIRLEESKYPSSEIDLKNFLKFLKTNTMEIKLFNKTKKGQIQEWRIEVVGNRYRTHEGLLGGKITTSEWTECKGKNIGKANETSPEEQAIKQAESIADKRVHAGSRRSVEELEEGKGWFQPMLAHKYSGQIPEHFIIAIQPKFDGMRCIVRKEGMFSRNGKPIIGAPHIFEELKPLFEHYPEIILDGELYNHELKNDFNEIISHVRKTKPTEEDLRLSREQIQYHCYDCYDQEYPNLNFDERIDFVHNLSKLIKLNYLKSVQTEWVTIDQIDGYYQQWLEDGYEGQMLRLNQPYDCFRSNSLLKRKEFIDEEFEILDIEEGSGNRSGMMGRIRYKTKEGREFTASSRGNEAYFRDLLINKDKYIGKRATVRYQNMTPDGSPRFPVTITIRDYE